MTATIDQIADTVVAELRAAPWTYTLEIDRNDAPRYTPESLAAKGCPVLAVCPRSDVEEVLSRAECASEYVIDVAIFATVSSDKPETLAPLREIAAAVKSLFRFSILDLEEGDDAVWMKSAIDPLWDVDALKAGVFVSVVSLTFKSTA